jgi:hypothetical protein
MSELLPSTPESSGGEPLLDTLLREAVPEIKLALGDLIDRENQRAIPDRYVKLLPEQTLVVTLRPDAGEAVQPIAGELERELTDSCMRHGSLYDRGYRVKLRVAPSPSAPLFRVGTRRGDEPEPEAFQVRRPAPVAAPAPAPAAPAAPDLSNATIAAPPPPPPPPAAEPAMDPDATRLDGAPAAAPAAEAGGSRFDGSRFVVVVEDEEGGERERFAIPRAMTTVGRQTDNPELRSDVAIADAPHVSRRQLALVWAPRGDTPGFTVYNLGLNPLHVDDAEITGANRGRGELKLEELIQEHTRWVAPGTALVIGEHGPVLRVLDTRAEAASEPAAEDVAEDVAESAPEVEMDPDATRLG